MSQRVEDNWPPAMVALNRQCDYYVSEIERLMAERDRILKALRYAGYFLPRIFIEQSEWPENTEKLEFIHEVLGEHKYRNVD